MGRPEEAERPAPRRARIYLDDWRWEVKDSRSVGEVRDGAEDAILERMVKGACVGSLRQLL